MRFIGGIPVFTIVGPTTALASGLPPDPDNPQDAWADQPVQFKDGIAPPTDGTLAFAYVETASPLPPSGPSLWTFNASPLDLNLQDANGHPIRFVVPSGW